jgi:5,5'-dehydrodivanillate O-demethylase oxygenase subunit
VRTAAWGNASMDSTDYVQAGPDSAMGKILRRYWQPVAVSEDVAVGKTVPIRILHEDLTLFRGQSGQPYLIAGRCAHRSTVLHIGWVEDECLRCRYHGWKYAGDGRCVEMPAEDLAFPPKVKLAGYPATDYAGLVFAYLGEGQAPPLPARPELDRDYGVKWTETKVWPCNWFQRLENAVDPVHVSFVHRGSDFGAAVSGVVPTIEVEETAWGMRSLAYRTPDNVRVNELHWPNCIHIVTPVLRDLPLEHPWSDLYNWYVPVDAETSVLFSARCAPLRGEAARAFAERLPPHRYYNPADEAAALFSGRKAPEAAIDPVAAQDYLAVLGQGSILDRAQERLGQSDVAILLLRRLFRAEMEAMAHGLPGKAWQIRSDPAHLPLPPGVPATP